MTEKACVLFVCTGNLARGQLAEALLRHNAGGRFLEYSAGLEPKGVHPDTLRVLAEIGIDAQVQTSKHRGTYLGRVRFDYGITVCSDADSRCPVFAGSGQRLSWPFDDPAAVTSAGAEKLAAFRAIRNQIAGRIGAWLAEAGQP